MKEGGLIYFLFGIYTVMINWFYNHSVIEAIVCWIFWPFYLIYSILVGHLSHHLWYDIPTSYFN